MVDFIEEDHSRTKKDELKTLIQKPIFLEPDNWVENVWGGSWIPEMKRMRVSKRVLIGESWEFSCHPAHPNRVRLRGNHFLTLPEIIARFPNEMLGQNVVAAFGPRAPILVKYVDARDNLSFQVHPSNEYARLNEKDSGKAEAWIVLGSGGGDDEGFLYIGFNPQHANAPDLNAQFRRVLDQGAESIIPYLNKIHVKPGDVFNVPPGTIHAIGRGVRLLEVQQSSNLTYRVWDWDRPASARPLTVEKAFDVLDFTPREGRAFRREAEKLGEKKEGKPDEWKLVENKTGAFALRRFIFKKEGEEIRRLGSDQFHVLTVLKGEVAVSEDPVLGRESVPLEVRQGRSVFLPGGLHGFSLASSAGPADVVESTVML